ncbi:MAG: M56 family metallopeptidase [Bacteroidales bacterium]|nr:M56 family metallopeptidase [Bacteroidales bacterium]
MNPLIIYLIQSAIGTGIFFLIYRLFIKRQNQFVYNRYYLLLTTFLATLMPAIPLPGGLFGSVGNALQMPTYKLQEVIVGSSITHGPTASLNWIFVLYGIGTIIFLGRVIWSLMSLFRLYLKKEKIKSVERTLIFIPDNGQVFSFFHWIFIPRSLYDHPKGKTILAHEKVHILQKHSLDLILTEFILVFQWFNPFLHLIRKEIKENHEYLADEGMGYSDQAFNNYKALLFQQSTGIEINPIVNHFSYSLLKKRMMMLKKQNNPNRTWVRFGWTLLAVMLVFAACNQPTNKPAEVRIPPPPPPATTESASKDIPQVTVTALADVAQHPEYKGGDQAMMKFLATHIKYPQTAKKEFIQGVVYATFIIEKDGSISDVKIKRGIGYGCDKEVIRVIKSMPTWIPGKNKKGEPVRSSVTLPVKFKLS